MPENHAAEIKALSQYLQAHSESMVFARLADRYLRMNEIDRAIEICQKGIGNHPNYAGAHFILAKCHLAKRQYDEMEKCLKRVCKLEPAFLPAHKMYGEFMGTMGQKKAQNDRYRLIQRIDPLAPVQIVEEPEPAPVKQPAPAVPVDSAAASFIDWPVSSHPEPGAAVEPLAMPEPLKADRPRTQSETPLQAVLHMPEEEELNLSFDASTFYEPPAQTEPAPRNEPARNLDIDLMPELEEPEEAPPASTDFEREEMRFSLMLDDLFSPNLEEEQKLEQETRTTLARAAQEEPVIKRPSAAPAESRPTSVQPPDIPMSRAPATPPRPSAPIMPPQTKAQRPAAPPAPPRMEPPRPQGQTSASAPRPATPPPMRPVVPPPPPAREVPPPRVKKSQPAPEPPAPRPTPPPVQEEKKSPLPEFGPDFSTYPESAGEDDLNAFIDHLDRMAGRDMDALAPEAPEKPVSFSPFEGTTESETAEEDDDAGAEKPKDKFVTPTLGEIYAAQGQYAKAINVFEMLLKKNPENEWYRTKLDYLRKRQAEEKN